MTTSPEENQRKLINFVQDPKNIKEAAEDSMDKRNKVMEETTSHPTDRSSIPQRITRDE